MIIFALSALSFMTACGYGSGALSDEALLDSVERRTFDYFWDGAEPNSGWLVNASIRTGTILRRMI